MIKKYLDKENVNRALESLDRGQCQLKEYVLSERALYLEKVAYIMEEKVEELAVLITEEMGKNIRESVLEIKKCISICRYYAEHGPKMLENELVEDSELGKAYISFDPLGIVLAIMPWNFPFWQVLRFAAPAIMAGNAVALKHANNVQKSAEALDEIFSEASNLLNAPSVFRNFNIDVESVKDLIADDRVQAVALTGSDLTGSKVAMESGKYIKKTILELGGSDPLIVFEDADLDNCVNASFAARMRNNGQTCTSPKRFLIQNTVKDRFLEKMLRKLETLKIGDPMDRKNDLGPMARMDLLDKLDKQIATSVNQGAKILYGGCRLEKLGEMYYSPTLLDAVDKDMPAFQEETFGPLIAVTGFDTKDEAIRLANDSKFGLCVSLWGENKQDLAGFANQLDFGSVFVNKVPSSSFNMPFGGVKRSGYGRELSHYGIKEFVNIKSIFIK
ncbi:aldehyde dehydrogenase family protein [Aureibacter tunicatorum]|uniref:Succinate-semialdehyde dehydrogenase/glutarate-semialdehyde dehydrogenase n=1 Tax=Aureibacter tunicatorum TaxID=866807 RepID=A0AAE3XLR4_9BACT|nr:aldehyde dehydrogenase family protein [Aureibacter tunicatorum]MDR6239237.1 succinate-semialdehyde dehydrogenase/glutarate-semialdehyde dehydrogenase [Aureibacter tunicatorum]BDD04838.1 succinate-semialdehyde dehydrogenase [Aureibacter tunicatorum]